MPAPLDPRLPGVYFLPPLPAAGAGLPRLDVAGFVGFARRGPLDLPVAVEDVGAYRDVFGDDLPLATEAGAGTAYAHLPRAVGDFFANGGRRCHVVRVAGPKARPARLRVPALVALGGTPGAAPVAACASSPGRWAARLRLLTRLCITPLPVQSFGRAGELTLAWQAGAAPDAVQRGDVLRLTFDGPLSGGKRWLFPVAEARRPAGGGVTALAATAAWQEVTSVPPSPATVVTSVARLTPAGAVPLAASGVVASGANGLTLDLAGASLGAVRRGDMLRVGLGGGDWLVTVADQRPGAAGSATLEVTAESMLRLQPRPLPARTLRRVELLRFDLMIATGDERPTTLGEVTFNAGHPRFWGEVVLLESSPRYEGASAPAAAAPALPGPAGGRASNSALSAAEAARLFRLTLQGRRIDPTRDGAIDPTALAGLLAPLGEDESRLTFLPLGMPAVIAASDPDAPGPDDPGDDDLGFQEAPASRPSAYSGRAFASVFLDAYLEPEPFNAAAGESARTLMTTAFDRYYVQDRRLRGLFSLLFVDEVALLSVPDAVHRPWGPADPAVTPTPPPPPPSPPAPPTCPPPASFAPCAQPAAPPTTGSARPAATPASHGSVDLPALRPPDEFDPGPLLAVQRSVQTFAEARGDVVGVLSLPQHYRKEQCVEWLGAFRQALGLRAQGQVLDSATEPADLSYVAVYHPWLLAPDVPGSTQLRAAPPDGAVCGMIGAREQRRQAWVAPANEPLVGVLDLDPELTTADWEELFALRFNLVRPEPRDFRAMSAHTLSDDRSLLQLSVRRLMILLRKVAAQRGADFVFESNHRRFRDGVRVMLENLLRFLFERGAFAGAAPEQAYRVATGDDVNTPQAIDQGRFVAEVRVAPSQPAEFLTVQLTRTGEGQFLAAEV
jgi:hypothetical protein